MKYFLSLLLVFVFAMPVAHAQSNPISAHVERIEFTQEEDKTHAKIHARVNDETLLFINSGDSFPQGVPFRLKEGTRIFVQSFEHEDEISWVLYDVDRQHGIYVILGIFVLLTLAVGLSRGLLSLFGLGLTVLILFGLILPHILRGEDPIIITVIGSILILGANIHLSHGFKKRTFLAFLGTTAGLALTIVFTYLFTWLTNLTGTANEDAVFLAWEVGTISAPVGILMAGIILGTVGVLDDVAVTQAEVVEEIVKADPKISKKDLFMSAMSIGRHHIASTVNTLILVYAGAALPLLLLAMHGAIGFELLHDELIIEELVRVLAGTSALILTVPIATAFATLPESVDTKKKKS